MTLSPEDRGSLARAKALLENPGAAATVTNLIGMPIERALALLPERWCRRGQRRHAEGARDGAEGGAADAG